MFLTSPIPVIYRLITGKYFTSGLPRSIPTLARARPVLLSTLIVLSTKEETTAKKVFIKEESRRRLG
jgi:hypothetical protein